MSNKPLDDWITTYAAEFCDPNYVRAASKRIGANGGTLSYVANLRERVTAARTQMNFDKHETGWLRFWRRILPATREQVCQINERLTAMAKTLDEILQDTTEEGTVIDSVLALVQGLKDQINGLGLSAEQQKKADVIFAAVEVNKAKLAGALTANTPANVGPASG